MRDNDLSVKERAVLFALMGEAREVSNSELAERAGFRLDGKERRMLNERKLVDSRKVGRAYAHELTDAGWEWCSTHSAQAPPGPASSMEGALYTILGGLTRYLEFSELSLADVFGRHDLEAPAKPEDIIELIGAAYLRLVSEPESFVKLRELRAELTDVPRRELDSTLAVMYRTQQANLVPQSNQQALTSADRESALRIGGENKHMISMRRG